jgi:hypothetical protein
MALVGKAHRGSDMRQCHALSQQEQRAFDTHVGLVSVRRQAVLVRKCLEQIVAAQSGDCGQFLQRNGPGKYAVALAQKVE